MTSTGDMLGQTGTNGTHTVQCARVQSRSCACVHAPARARVRARACVRVCARTHVCTRTRTRVDACMHTFVNMIPIWFLTCNERDCNKKRMGVL